MKAIALILFAALLATASAQAGVWVYSIYSESTCQQANLIGMVSDIVADAPCTAYLCEQIGTTGQYRTLACLSEPGTPPANFIQWNLFSDNNCTTYTNYSAVVPNTCVQVRDVGAVKFQACSGGSFTQIQAATVADCNSNTNTATVNVDTSQCVDMMDGKTFTKGVCPAGSNTPTAAPTSGTTPTAAPTSTTPSSTTPSKAPAKASSAATTALSALSLAAGLVIAL